MHVFSSMRSEDVLTSETSKLGVVSLRGFLQFAEKGTLDSQITHTGKAPDSDFEVAVMEALRKAGFECEPQVGVAGFYIDLAVKDPGCPGRYLLGIECDGATYHSAKSARDRDRLCQEVLERLGWKISRIWSTDWFSNPDEVLSPIIRKLHQLITLHVLKVFNEKRLFHGIQTIDNTIDFRPTATQFINSTFDLVALCFIMRSTDRVNHSV